MLATASWPVATQRKLLSASPVSTFKVDVNMESGEADWLNVAETYVRAGCVETSPFSRGNFEHCA